MVLGRTGVNVLTELRFSSMRELKSCCDLTLKTKQSIHHLSSTKAFSNVERLYDEGKLRLKEGDEEYAYQLFSRMGNIAEIIIRKSDFDNFKHTPPLLLNSCREAATIDHDGVGFLNQFNQIFVGSEGIPSFSAKDGRRFYDLFEKCVSHLDELAESLEKRYELKEVERVYDENKLNANDTDGHLTLETTNDEDDDIAGTSMTIEPRDLMRYIDGKHQVLIIDYRNDQAEVIRCSSTGRLLVAQVPADAVVPGCIGSSLIRSVAIGERVLLQRMADVDLVVLMGETVPSESDTLVVGSKEQILYSALFTYNSSFRPRRPPLFMKGGFESWRLCYPMHTSSLTASRKVNYNFDSPTEFAKAVAEYKKDVNIHALKYPDLSRRPVTKSMARPLEIPYADVASNRDISVSATVTSETSSSQLNVTSVEIVDEVSKQEAVRENISAQMNGKRAMPSAPCPGGTEQKRSLSTTTAQTPSVSATSPVVHTQPPIIDRKKKPYLTTDGDKVPRERSRPTTPSTQPQAIGGAKIYDQGTVAPLPVINTIPIVPDRSMKPIAPGEDARWLSLLYDSMMKTIDASAVRRRNSPGYTGLYNLGNTCFMNATLQALFNTALLQRIFTKKNFIGYINRSNKMGTLGVISSAFSALMDAVWSGSYAVLRPQQFLETFANEVNSSLADHRQHDAQEFQIYLLDSLHEDTNRVTKPVPFEQNYLGNDLMAEAMDYAEKLRKFGSSPVNDLFSCHTVSILQCNTCCAQSATFEEMTELSIEIPNRSSSSILDCLESHFRPVILDGSCKWHCPRCKGLRIATRTTHIWSLPRVLIVHLKRFTFVADGWQKNDSYVSFDTLPLDLSACEHPVVRNSKRITNDFFSLYAVVNHKGSLNSGHYTTYARNQETKEWLLFDDDSVSTVSADAVCSRNAFILYFMKDNLY